MIIKNPEDQYRRQLERDIQNMKDQFAEERKLITDDVIRSTERTLQPQSSMHNKFVLATMYIKSHNNNDRIRRGIQWLREILQENEEYLVQMQMQRQQPGLDDYFLVEQPPTAAGQQQQQQQQHNVNGQQQVHRALQYRRDCLYYIALGHYFLEDLPSARKSIESMLHNDPQNEQAKKMLKLIESDIRDQGTTGLAIAAGAGIGAAALVGVAALGTALLIGLTRR